MNNNHAKNTIRIVSDCRIYTTTTDLAIRLARAVTRQSLDSARIISRPINATIWAASPDWAASPIAIDRMAELPFGRSPTALDQLLAG